MAEKQFRLWLGLVEYCEGTVERKMFRILTDQFANAYKRMSVADQGEFHRLVYEWQPKVRL